MKKNAGSTRQSNRHRKKTAKSMFIRGFLQSFFIVAILLTAGILGYQMTMQLWMVPEKGPEITASPELTPTPEPITVPRVDEVSKNLIFCYDSKTGVISKLILEVFHCERKQLTYLTIPMSTQFTMSDTLYKKLIAIKPSIPQMLRLSAMVRYLDASVVFDYGVLMVEDMLGIDISYYTVIPTKLYQTIFEEQSITDGISAADLLGIKKEKQTQEKDGTGNSGIEKDDTEVRTAEKDTDETQEAKENSVVAEVFTKQYIKTIRELDSREEISTYIEEMYTDLTSNLNVREKMNYLESYSKTTLWDVTFTRLAGDDKNSGFVTDQEAVRQQLLELGAY